MQDTATAIRWSIARIKGTPEQEALPLLPEKFQKFAVLANGVVVGELKWDAGRWKSAGGPAWKGTLFNSETMPHPHKPRPSFIVGIDYHARRKEEVLHWFKTGEMKR